MVPARVILAEDRAENLEQDLRALRDVPQVAVVGVARSGREALDQIALLEPDVVFLDLLLRGMGGLETTHRVRELSSAPRVVLLTLGEEFDHRFVAREVGAAAIVKRSDLSRELPGLMQRLAPAPLPLALRQPWLGGVRGVALRPLPPRAITWLRELTPKAMRPRR